MAKTVAGKTACAVVYLSVALGLPASSQVLSSTQWTSIGPRGLSLCFAAYGCSIDSGHVEALAVDPRNPNTVYAGAAAGGVWKTIDGGVNWTPLTDSQPSLFITALTLDPFNPDTVYAATGNYRLPNDPRIGALLKSSDGGKTWSQVAFGPPSAPALQINSFAVMPGNGSVLLAAGVLSGLLPGIFRSQDGGSHWTPVLTVNVSKILFDPVANNIAYAATITSGTPAGIMKSRDGGVTWTLFNGTGPNTLPYFDYAALAISASSPSTLYAVLSNSGRLVGVYKTIDGAASWTKVATPMALCDPQCDYTPLLGVHPTNPNVVFAGGLNLWRSTDGGGSWTYVGSPANAFGTYVDQHAIAFSQDGSKVYEADDGGVNSSTDALSGTVHWTGLNTSLVVTEFYPGFSIDPKNPNITVAGAQDTGAAAFTGSATWNQVQQSDCSYGLLDPKDEVTAYFNCNGLVQIGNINSYGASPIFGRGGVISPLVMDPSNSDRLYFGAAVNLYQTLNRGSSWVSILTANNGIGAIAVAPSDSNVVYAASDNVWTTKNALAGTAATWISSPVGLVNQIAVDQTNANVAYVVLGTVYSGDNFSRVLRTSDTGTTWTDISGDLPMLIATDIAVDPDLPNTLYVSLQNGVYKTSNGGITWSLLGSGLPNASITGLRLHRASRILRVSTFGRGMWDLCVGGPCAAGLSISKVHSGNVALGQQNATYTVTVSNAANDASASGSVTVIETLPSGLALVSMAGSGWTCTLNTCHRSDSLAGGASYPPITVTVNVASNATTPQVNHVSVSGGGSATANASDSTTIIGANQASLSVSRKTLNFGLSGSLVSSTQSISVSLTGGGGVNWTASSNQANIIVSPAAGTGSGTFQVTANSGASGVVTVTALGVVNSPQQIQVNVVTVTPGNPYGSFDTPLNNATGIAGAIPVTGWALDKIEVTTVGIYRDPIGNEPTPPNGLVYIGNSTFVAGARPDVEATYPSAPLNYRAGWGYMLLTNFLPNSGGSPGPGNGIYKLHAIAVNKAGNQVDLGTRTITVDNAHASKPFGTIDTPGQGDTISGNAYVNFGWALTQNPSCVPTDGSTITVYVDGAPVGRPAYNQFRSDIATFFPGLCNTNGAVGFFYIDTTQLSNGVHTISWVIYDNRGLGDGIGSRYFNVQNSGGVAAPDSLPIAPALQDDVNVEIEELVRIEIPVGASDGYMLVNGEQRPLPVGSSLKGGIFYWQIGLAFLGEYELVFERPDSTRMRVGVTVHSKRGTAARLPE